MECPTVDKWSIHGSKHHKEKSAAKKVWATPVGHSHQYLPYGGGPLYRVDFERPVSLMWFQQIYLKWGMILESGPLRVPRIMRFSLKKRVCFRRPDRFGCPGLWDFLWNRVCFRSPAFPKIGYGFGSRSCTPPYETCPGNLTECPPGRLFLNEYMFASLDMVAWSPYGDTWRINGP